MPFFLPSGRAKKASRDRGKAFLKDRRAGLSGFSFFAAAFAFFLAAAAVAGDELVNDTAEHAADDRATQKSQSCFTAMPPTNTATAVERAGFTDVFVTGMLMRWMSVRQRPIAMGSENRQERACQSRP